MTLRTLTALPSHGFMAVFVAIFFGYVDQYLSKSGAISFPAAYIFLALLVGFGVVLFIQAAVSARLKDEIIALYAAHAWVLAALVAIMFCAFLFAFFPGAYWDEGPRHLLFPFYGSLIVFFSMLLPVRQHHRRHFHQYLLCAFVVLLSSVFVDACYPATFSLQPDRAAGFAENANTAAFVLVLLCSCLVDFERRRLKSHVLMALTSLGVLTTLSRGGGILLALLFAYYAYRIVGLDRHRPIRVFRNATSLVVLAAIVLATGVFLVRRTEMFALSFQPRLAMLSGTEELVPSDEGRIDLLNMFVEELVKSPVIGYGTGYTNSFAQGPHNMYVQQWINNGLPGLLAYLMLLFTCARVFWKPRFSRGLLFIGLVTINGVFSHNILEERAVLALLGVLLTVSFYGGDALAVSPDPAPSRRSAPRPRFRSHLPRGPIRPVVGQPREV
jgi:O-antigen ligase